MCTQFACIEQHNWKKYNMKKLMKTCRDNLYWYSLASNTSSHSYHLGCFTHIAWGIHNMYKIHKTHPEGRIICHSSSCPVSA